MNIKKSWFTFRRDDLPSWQCPTCGGASLNLKPEDLRTYDSAETVRFRTEDWFDADFVQYRFSAVLHCANNRCNETVTMVGMGKVEEEHEQDHEGQWNLTYFDKFTPLFFQPSLIPISIPQDTPSSVSNSLMAASSIIFANRNAAANQLRASIEVLLDDRNIKAIRANGKFIPLGERINDHLNDALLKYKDRLSAIQWIGNDGSHGGGDISIEDLLAGLEIIESLLAELYPSTKNDPDELARKIIELKKPKTIT